MTPTTRERTPLIIADEINSINRRTENILLAGALEIGQRLKEAKALVKHGEWGQWLADSVHYSQRSAGRLIRLYEEYGPFPDPDSASDSNWSALSNLTYTNALILLDVPAEQRPDFIAHHDVENMSSRELKQAAGAAKSGGERTGAQELPDSDSLLLHKIDTLQNLLLSMTDKIDDLTRQILDLEQRLADAYINSRAEQPDAVPTKPLAPAESAISTELTVSKAEPAISPESIPSAKSAGRSSGSRSPAFVPYELVTADFPSPEAPSFTTSGFENADPEYYTRQAETLFEFHRANIHRSFDQLKLLLTALAAKDKDQKERLRKQLKTFLENMAKLINQWPPPIKMT